MAVIPTATKNPLVNLVASCMRSPSVPTTHFDSIKSPILCSISEKAITKRRVETIKGSISLFVWRRSRSFIR